MKKLLSVLAVMAFTMTVATAAESQLQNYVNKKLEPVAKKEQELKAKQEAQQKADAQRRAELQKKQEADKAKLEQAKKDAQARQQARKDAIQAEKDYINSFKKK